jgi:hypothetical protein
LEVGKMGILDKNEDFKNGPCGENGNFGEKMGLFENF